MADFGHNAHFVNDIGRFSFPNCEGVTSITIPDSVKEIGEKTFSHCTALSSIAIPGSVESLGAANWLRSGWLTESCSTKKRRLVCCSKEKSENYEIPNTFKTIDDYAFHKCIKLTSVNVLDSFTGIFSMF